MRVLWFCNGDLSAINTSGYNGGGWMRSLLGYIKKEDVSLGVVTMGARQSKNEIDGIVFYSVCCLKKLRSKILDKFRSLSSVGEEMDERYLKEYLTIVSDFHPDIIQVWGTENNYGLIASKVDIPCVIHIQGLINPYKDFLLPPSYSIRDYSMRNGFLYALRHRKEMASWEYQANRERLIFSHCKNFIGRTDWDRTITMLFSPSSTYYFCNEMLRKEFMETPKWHLRKQDSVKIISVISPPLYKGANVILRTAKLLSEITDIQFEWNVYGVKSAEFTERHEAIAGKDVNVYWRGTATAEELASHLLESTVYVHPSYIDNSPNSVCEAQYIGIPIIAANVGGVSSLINDGINGILVQSHDAYMLAGKIKMLVKNSKLQEALSNNAIQTATKRHNPQDIMATLLEIYKKMIEK